MLILQSRLSQMPVASIQVSHRIGYVNGFVLQPKDLKVAALIVESPISKQPLFLYVEDIVELRPKGVLINHNEQLMEADGLVRLEKLLDTNFQIIGKKVIDENKRRVGTATDFVINANGWLVQKIHAEPSLVRMLNRPDRVIDRRQVIRVSDKEIVVKSANLEEEEKGTSRGKQRLLNKLKPEASASKRS